MTIRTHNAPKRVYFVRPVGMDGPIKIGCSADPDGRLKVLSAWSPFPLELIGSVPGDFKEEGHIHRRFSNLHTRKEWFMSSPLLRGTIERILAGTPIKEACKDIVLDKPIKNQKRVPLTPDRQLFVRYGHRIRGATGVLSRVDKRRGNYHPPEDVTAIMHNWRRDVVNSHLPIPPTPAQIARLEQFLADPAAYAVFRFWDESARAAA